MRWAIIGLLAGTSWAVPNYVSYINWCQVGGLPVTVQGLTSAQNVQRSYGACTVTVRIHGGGLAVLYRDKLGDVLSNPFTAQTNGLYQFFVDVEASGAEYDITTANGTPSPGFPTPITLSDVFIAAGGGGGGGIPSTCGVANDIQSNGGTNVLSCDTGLGVLDAITHTISENIINGNLGVQVSDATHTGDLCMSLSNGTTLTSQFCLTLDAAFTTTNGGFGWKITGTDSGGIVYASGGSTGPASPSDIQEVQVVSAKALATDSNGKPIAATYQGNGAKVQLSTSTTTTNDCVKFDANGNTVDSGSACGTGSGTVTNIATTAPLAGGPITTTGTLSITGAAGQVLAGASPAFTATPSLGTDGSVAGTMQLANGSAAFHTILSSGATANYTFKFPPTAGTSTYLLKTDGSGNTDWVAPGSGGVGTVTSFSAGTLSPLFTTSVATATTTPALTFALTNAAANTVFGNFTSGSAAPSYNAVSACGDSSHALGWTAGTGFACQAISVGTGTVTSVAMTGDNVIYNTSVTGSPITTSGTLVPSLKTETANFGLFGPTSGSAATPTFRAMVNADLPARSVVACFGSIASAATPVETRVSMAGTFSSNFATVGTLTSSVNCGTNQAGSITYTLVDCGTGVGCGSPTTLGTAVITSSCVVTFATTGAATQAFAINDWLKWTPSGTDASGVNVCIATAYTPN